MTVDVRQLLWESACAIADHLALSADSVFDVPVELETRFNGGVAPQVARHYGEVLNVRALPDGARILDLGCGYGRLAMELTRRLRPDQQYVGLDPNTDGIEWARRHIGSRHPNFTFERIDVRSRPYNPGGHKIGSAFRFPFDDGSLDLIFMISVLTHVDLPTVENYLRESARTLKPATGRLISTIFLLDDDVESLIADGRSRFSLPHRAGRSRVENRDDPELVIAHPRQEVLDLLTDAGFARTTVIEGHWSGRPAPPMDFQDLLIADRTTGVAYRHPTVGARQPVPDPDSRSTSDRLPGFTSRDEVMRFALWCVSVTLNVLWWTDRGLTVAGSSPPSWQLGHFRRLGLAAPRPTANPQFHSIDEAGIVELLVRAGTVPSGEELMGCLQDALGNGLLVVEALRAGDRPVLRAPDGTPVAVPFPAPPLPG